MKSAMMETLAKEMAAPLPVPLNLAGSAVVGLLPLQIHVLSELLGLSRMMLLTQRIE